MRIFGTIETRSQARKAGDVGPLQGGLSIGPFRFFADAFKSTPHVGKPKERSGIAIETLIGLWKRDVDLHIQRGGMSELHGRER